MKQSLMPIKSCKECRFCRKFQNPIALVCVHSETCKRVSNDKGLRIDEPKEYLNQNGFPDWCPLEDVKE